MSGLQPVRLKTSCHHLLAPFDLGFATPTDAGEAADAEVSDGYGIT